MKISGCVDASTALEMATVADTVSSTTASRSRARDAAGR